MPISTGLLSNIYKCAGFNLCFWVAVIVWLMCASQEVQAEEQGVVLITHKSSPLKELNLLQIRRLYLGFGIKNKYVNRPVINRSGDQLYRDFLKNIMHMTEDGYKRKIVRRVFRHGSDYIRELNSVEEIASHLKVYTRDVVFVPVSNLDRLEDAKVIVRLW